MANNNKSPEEQAALDESLSLLEKVEQVPAYKLAAKGPSPIESALKKIGSKQFSKDFINQALFDIGAQTFNEKAVPMNLIGGFLGYNPGFSGERLMQNIQKRFGWGEEGRVPTPRSDPDYPMGVFAPKGGELAWNKKEEVKAPPVATAIKEEEVAPVTKIAAPSYTVSDIDPKIKTVFDEILSLDDNMQEAYFNAMPLEQKDALSMYRDSMLDEEYKVRLAKEEGKKKEGYVYNPDTDTDVRKNAPNL